MKLLKDKNGRTRGFLVEQIGRTVLRDPQGATLGWYDKNQNRTFDKSGRYVGNDNQLTILLEE